MRLDGCTGFPVRKFGRSDDVNINTILAILAKADPLHNSNSNERLVALGKANEAMDRMGLSMLSLGYSQADAERIQNQSSVSIASKSHKRSGVLFSKMVGGISGYSNHGNESSSSSAPKVSSEWEYHFESDGNGAVPSWDGYNGE